MNPYHTDIIGSKLFIIDHSDPSLKNLEGKVVDERKNIIVIETENGKKTIPKSRSKVLIEGRIVNLEEIRVRPEDKIKKMRRRSML